MYCTRDNQGHFRKIKGSSYLERLTGVKHTFKINQAQFDGLKKEIEKSSIIIWVLIPTSFSVIDRNPRSKISISQNNTITHLDLIDIYRTQNPVTVEYAYFSGIHGTFNKITMAIK